MASTNKTAHYEFPQYIGSDIPNILTDINPAFETIDTALYEQGQQIAEQTTDLSDIQEAVDQATADVAVMQSSIVAMAGIVETTRQLATDNKETIGQGTLDTTAQTLIGAVNELNDESTTVMAEVTADGVKTYGAVLKDLATAFFASHDEQPQGEYKIAEIVAGSDIESYYDVFQIRYLTSASHMIRASRTLSAGGTTFILTDITASVANDSSYVEGRITAASTEVTDKTSTVPAAGVVLQVIKA